MSGSRIGGGGTFADVERVGGGPGLGSGCPFTGIELT